MKELRQRILSNIFGEMSREDWLWLLFPGRHMALLSTRRAAMIISRVHLVALIFSVLTLIFIIPDLLFLPWPTSGYLTLGRIAASAAFVGLIFSCGHSQRMRDAYILLGWMFVIPTLFYIFSSSLLAQPHLNSIEEASTAIYAFLPLIIVAGLSMFPLTALEAVLFASPLIIAEVISSILFVDHLDISPLISTTWLLIVIAMVATLSGMSQLGFMIALVRTALRDALTGCFSRMSGMELLEIQFSLASRSDAPLAIAFIDLDNFKSVNDKYGHEAGDQVLISAGEHIRSLLRTGDILARWGGEEFILIMPNTYCSGAVMAMAKLREAGLGLRPDNQPMTASIGIAERTEDNAPDWKALVDLADKRMYEAKQKGKNRSVYSCSELHGTIQ